MLTALASVRTRAWYAWLTFALPPAAVLGQALTPGTAVWKGQGLGVLVPLAVTLIAVVLWWGFSRSRGATPLETAFFGLALATWLTVVIRIQADGSLFNLSAFAAPVILLMLWFKPPSLRDLDRAILVLAYGLAFIAVISIPLGFAGLMPNGFEAADSALCRTSILCDLTGGLNRWAGPFGSVNYAAPVGGLLVVIGVTQSRWNRIALIVIGMAILLLSQGRSAVFGVLAALVVIVLCGQRVSDSVHRRAIRVFTVLAGVIAVVAYIVIVDPTFNGRSAIWTDFVHLWSTSPLTGVGDSGVRAYVENRVGMVTFTHAHSVLLDTLVRWGVLPALLALSVFIVAFAAAGRAVRTLGSAPLAVVTFVLAAGLTETIHDWAYWSIYLAALAWAVLTYGAAATMSVRRPPSLS